MAICNFVQFFCDVKFSFPSCEVSLLPMLYNILKNPLREIPSRFRNHWCVKLFRINSLDGSWATNGIFE